jgi:hypothetical protein
LATEPTQCACCSACFNPRAWQWAVEINTGGMNTSIDFYHLLARRKLTSSLRDYSSHYLGMAENYACLRGERAPSERAMINLFRRLWEEKRVFLALRVACQLLFRQSTDDAQ